MTAFYFIVHDLMAYAQHGDMMCCKVSPYADPIRKKPRSVMFKKMKIGDKIVYYAAGSFAILGIFEVVSDMLFFSDDVWKDVFVRKIKPYKLPPNGKFLHIKKILFNSDFTFDIFPNKELWHTALRGKTVKLLSEPDYEFFLKNIDNQEYLVSKWEIKKPVTVWQKSMGNKQGKI